MRILIVHPGIYVYGGAELVIVRLANYLTAKGMPNALLTTAIVPEMQKELAGTQIIIAKRFKGMPLNLLNEIIGLHKGIRRIWRNFDVINVHNFPAELSIFACGRPVVWMCNEPPEVAIGLGGCCALLKKLAKKAVLSLDKFVVRNYISNAVVADEINSARFQRIYGIKPEVINYGIDYDFFSRGDKDKTSDKFNLSGGFNLLQVGMLTPLKNQMASVRTIEQLKGKIPNIKLILAGWGEAQYVHMLKSYVHEKRLHQQVVFTGHLDRAQIRDLYHACDILLHPVKSQGAWLAPFEALCARMALVVSPGMTAANIIEQEELGLVRHDFATAVWEIYNNRDRFYKMAEKASGWVKDNLSWDNFCGRMAQILYKAMEAGKR